MVRTASLSPACRLLQAVHRARLVRAGAPHPGTKNFRAAVCMLFCPLWARPSFFLMPGRPPSGVAVRVFWLSRCCLGALGLAGLLSVAAPLLHLDGGCLAAAAATLCMPLMEVPTCSASVTSGSVQLLQVSPGPCAIVGVACAVGAFRWAAGSSLRRFGIWLSPWISVFCGGFPPSHALCCALLAAFAALDASGGLADRACVDFVRLGAPAGLP